MQARTAGGWFDPNALDVDDERIVMGVYEQVDAAMTDDERAAFLDRMVGLNPHLAGGSVADFLEMLNDTDADVAVAESIAGQLSDDLDRALLGACVSALLYARDLPIDVNRLHDLYAASVG